MKALPRPIRLTLTALSLMALAVLTGFLTWWAGGEGSVNSPHPSADRIEVVVNVDSLDTEASSAQVTWWIEPHGRWDADGAPRGNVVLSIPALSDADVALKAGVLPTARAGTLELRSGDATAYPFDVYRATLDASAEVDGEPVPTSLTLSESDAAFIIDGVATTQGQGASAAMTVQRTYSSRVFAVFMAVVMWALALSVAVASYVVTSGRRGFVWPAMGWMAATLFALVAFRNAAPGSPPIGCLLDLTAFFWAEAIVVASLLWVVVKGLGVELEHAS